MNNWESRRDFDVANRLAKEEVFVDMLEALEAAEVYLAKRVGHLPASEGYRTLATIRTAIAKAKGVTP